MSCDKYCCYAVKDVTNESFNIYYYSYTTQINN